MKSSSVEAKEVNDRLDKIYGRHVLADKPHYRIVWSDDQYEKRLGEFNYKLGSEILSTKVEVREVPKYDWLENQWVVEKLMENTQPDVWDGSYIYNPLYAFPSGLPVKWEAIQLLISHVLSGERNQPKSATEAAFLEDQKMVQAKKDARHLLDEENNPSDVQIGLEDKTAVAFGGIKRLGDM